jgi:DNA mismatch endonuclease (patch repair protein)
MRPATQKPSPERSATMRAVKSRDTAPELSVRKIVRSMASGYRLCRADLPGKPDIVFGRKKLAIFVHGCFWHGHDCARGARMPKTNRPYWQDKIARNRARDLAHVAALEVLGWRALVIYECELKNPEALRQKLGAALA